MELKARARVFVAEKRLRAHSTRFFLNFLGMKKKNGQTAHVFLNCRGQFIRNSYFPSFWTV